MPTLILNADPAFPFVDLVHRHAADVFLGPDSGAEGSISFVDATIGWRNDTPAVLPATSGMDRRRIWQFWPIVHDGDRRSIVEEIVSFGDRARSAMRSASPDQIPSESVLILIAPSPRFAEPEYTAASPIDQALMEESLHMLARSSDMTPVSFLWRICVCRGPCAAEQIEHARSLIDRQWFENVVFVDQELPDTHAEETQEFLLLRVLAELANDRQFKMDARPVGSQARSRGISRLRGEIISISQTTSATRLVTAQHAIDTLSRQLGTEASTIGGADHEHASLLGQFRALVLENKKQFVSIQEFVESGVPLRTHANAEGRKVDWDLFHDDVLMPNHLRQESAAKAWSTFCEEIDNYVTRLTETVDDRTRYWWATLRAVMTSLDLYERREFAQQLDRLATGALGETGKNRTGLLEFCDELRRNIETHERDIAMHVELLPAYLVPARRYRHGPSFSGSLSALYHINPLPALHAAVNLPRWWLTVTLFAFVALIVLSPLGVVLFSKPSPIIQSGGLLPFLSDISPLVGAWTAFFVLLLGASIFVSRDAVIKLAARLTLFKNETKTFDNQIKEAFAHAEKAVARCWCLGWEREMLRRVEDLLNRIGEAETVSAELGKAAPARNRQQDIAAARLDDPSEALLLQLRANPPHRWLPLILQTRSATSDGIQRGEIFYVFKPGSNDRIVPSLAFLTRVRTEFQEL